MGVFSELMFPSRIKPEQPIDPGYVRKRLQVILERAGCKRVRFHDLRHTFATLSLENGMDVKTLSTIIGHVSSATTLNTYTHITDEMRRKAALNIDQGIAKAEVGLMPEQTDEPPKSRTLCRLNRPGAGREPAASANCGNISGRAAIPRCGRTAKNTPEMSMPRPVRSARRS